MPISIQHQRSANRTLRIVCPNGHLGFAPIKTGSFEIGVASEPDLICRRFRQLRHRPGPLGADISSSPLAWQTHDLEHMLLARARLGVPMIIGSAGDTGTQQPRRPVRADHPGARAQARAAGFPRRLVLFRSRQGTTCTAHRRRRGRSQGLDDRPALDAADARRNRPHRRGGRRASVHRAAGRGRRRDHRRPQQRLRDLRRAGDPRTAIPEALAYYYGKVLECASFCAEPYGGKESVLGEITMDDVKVTAMLPDAALHDRLGRRTRDVRARATRSTNTCSAACST